MPPELTETLSTRNSVKMLAIMKQWEDGSGCQTDNTEKYLALLLFKLGLDAVVFYLCCRKLHASFLSLCSMSLLLADVLVACCMAAVWFFGAERSPVSACLFLAHTSATFGALPLPMMCLGLLDYCIEDTNIGRQSTFCKFLRNMVLTLLVWTQAVIYSLSSVKAKMMELDYMTGIKAVVCEVEESTLVPYFILGLFTTVFFTMLPFCSRITQWVKEAGRISELREEQENQGSDLFISAPSTETKSSKEYYLETTQPRPPLWFSLTLGFTTIWMPYLIVSVACLVLGYGAPAYITVNLLWLECTNSLLVVVVLWLKSKWLGPYSQLPENVCLLHVYWHLSKGRWQQQLPTGVFNPSKRKRSTLLYV
ncbi:probable G-protein coupled receptor 160 isoform X2 [Seriola lalandi dorsalis]|nr:probable G-protein coupled receptor 160 isoform X2 [Seriola lalandi dorsalis]XP_023283470.1 probable G-protein coupled receptor 160 isoform X2 [Seriola lalandi dorsalis]